MKDSLISAAIRLAVKVHNDQVDKAGEPYIFHVMRVAMAMDTEEERIVAFLHDAAEDSVYPKLILKVIAREFGGVVYRAVKQLTRTTHSYDIYLCNLRNNPLAVKVKIADLTDNCNPERLAKLEPIEAERLRAKYEGAIATLKARLSTAESPASPDATT